jgi:hypothetical protein
MGRRREGGASDLAIVPDEPKKVPAVQARLLGEEVEEAEEEAVTRLVGEKEGGHRVAKPPRILVTLDPELIHLV